MSIFPREFELLIAFLCREIPMWKTIFGPDCGKVEFHRLIANQVNLLKWSRGTRMSKRSPAMIFEKAQEQVNKRAPREHRERFLKQIEEFRIGYFEHRDDFDIRAAAAVLEMPIEMAYRAIDAVSNKLLPLYPAMLYRGQKQLAEKHFRTFRGAWKVWVRRERPDGQILYLLAALRVRETAEIAQGYALRCKLNFPVINVRRHSAEYHTPAKPYQYDGFLAVPAVQDHLNFSFEFRQDGSLGDMREDYFHIMTSWIEEMDDGVEELRGDYLTMDQGGSPRQRVKDSLVMRRASKDDRDAMLACMRDVRVIRNAEERERVAAIFHSHVY